jgi:hypothetical protein
VKKSKMTDFLGSEEKRHHHDTAGFYSVLQTLFLQSGLMAMEPKTCNKLGVGGINYKYFSIRHVGQGARSRFDFQTIRLRNRYRTTEYVSM